MERDFQDGATEINKIAFCKFCDEKEAKKRDGIKGVYTIPPFSPLPPVLASSYFIFQSPKMFYFWLIVIVVIIILKIINGRKHHESIRESYYDRDSKDMHAGICTNPQKGAQCMNRMIDLSDSRSRCMVCARLMHKKNTSKDCDNRDNNNNRILRKCLKVRGSLQLIVTRLRQKCSQNVSQNDS